MKSYEKQISEFGYELADEIIRVEKDKNFNPSLDRFKVAGSLSIVYDVELRKVNEDLDNSIRFNLKKLKNPFNLEKNLGYK